MIAAKQASARVLEASRSAHMPTRKIICLEFNELCPSLLSRWMSEGQLPNFRKFFEQSQILTAVADEPGPENLEPWIQWYSFHTGLPYREHGVQNLTDGPIAPHDDIWKVLKQHGLRVACCGSMNAKAVSGAGNLFVPDPWCTNQSAFPEQWNSYHRLVAGLVQDSTLPQGRSVGRRDYARFMSFVASHGLRPATIWRLLKQIGSDTLLKRPTSWRRAALLDKVQFDVFKWYWRRERPDFASFFLNSTAHYQHAYWHCTFPEEFTSRPSQDEVDRFGAAILYGYQQMDELLSRFFRLERDGALLILCTALSQESVGRTDRVFYRLKEVPRLLAALGLEAREILPVMSEQFNVRFASVAEAERAQAAMRDLRANGNNVLFFRSTEPDSLLLGAAARYATDEQTPITGLPASRAALRFGDLFYRLPTTKATTHNPESLIWVKTGSHAVHKQKVSLLDWYPTMLDFYGIPSQRTHGRSLLPTLGALA